MRPAPRSRRYAQEGDTKPRHFKVGDLFVYRNGETALVTEVFDRYKDEGTSFTSWTLRLMWAPGKDGEVVNQQKDGSRIHGALANNMFNALSIGRGLHLYPVKEGK